MKEWYTEHRALGFKPMPPNPTHLFAGGVQEALTERYTEHLRELAHVGHVPGDTAALREAVKKLRDAERAPADAPKVRSSRVLTSNASGSSRARHMHSCQFSTMESWKDGGKVLDWIPVAQLSMWGLPKLESFAGRTTCSIKTGHRIGTAIRCYMHCLAYHWPHSSSSWRMD